MGFQATDTIYQLHFAENNVRAYTLKHVNYTKNCFIYYIVSWCLSPRRPGFAPWHCVWYRVKSGTR